MIKVARASEPDGFQDRARAWKARFAEERRLNQKITAGTVWKKVRPGIAADAAILAEGFNFKCVYCEAKPGHVSHPHIEHYRPKGLRRFESKMFDWDNWLVSCGVCNLGKSRQFPEESGTPLLLDPTTEDPLSHLVFVGPRLRGITVRGRKTVELVKLDRKPLNDERGSWLNVINLLLLLYVESQSDVVKNECRRALIWTMQKDAPFSGMTKSHLQKKCSGFVNPVTPHPEIRETDMHEKIAALLEGQNVESLSA